MVEDSGVDEMVVVEVLEVDEDLEEAVVTEAVVGRADEDVVTAAVEEEDQHVEV